MHEVLAIRDVAQILELDAMANASEIPALKIWGQWRITRTELDTWLDAQPCGGDHPLMPGSNGEPRVGAARVHRNARLRREAE